MRAASCLLLAGALAASAGAETTVSGPISANTTWTKANQPYHVTATVTVSIGVTLTIEPGVDVLLDSAVQLVVQGRLQAVGTETDSIRFLKGTAPEWGGISISGGDSSTIGYARVSDGHGSWGGGILADGSGTRLALAHAVISGNSTDQGAGGLYNGNEAALTVTDCAVVGNYAAFAGGGLSNFGTLTMSNCLISGNLASQMDGGGLYNDHTALATLTDCIISNNSAQWGGGLRNSTSATLTMTRCSVRGNTAYVYGGGVANIQDATLTMTKCSVTGNTAQHGGGVYNTSGNPALTMTNCTISGNSASARAGAIYTYSTLAMVMTNSIIWGNDAPENPELYPEFGSGPVLVSYSDIRGDTTWAGTGNINADPIFVNAAEGNYHIRQASPCRDAGDPASPPDPDGSRADMGAFPLQGEMVLPNVSAQPGSVVGVPVRGTVGTAYSAEIVFTVDQTIAMPDTPFVVGNAFQGKASADVTWNRVGDTIFVALSAAEPITLNDQMLVDLRFKVNPGAPVGDTAHLVWVPSLSFFNETPVSSLISGSLKTGTMRGDVSDDGILTALDASFILQYVVRMRALVNEDRADVTCNGRVSAFDAAWILIKVLNPGTVFPCDGGEPLPGTKLAPAVPLALRWERDGSGWALRADHAGMLAGDLVLALGDVAPVAVSGGGQVAYRQDGKTLRVAFVTLDGDEPVLFRIAPTEPPSGSQRMDDVQNIGHAPRIVQAELNEGEVDYTIVRPAEFSLAQNVPNPFNPTTTLRFGLPEAGHVTLAVYDVTGRLVRTLVDGLFDAGAHDVVWDGRDALGREVSSGLYFSRLTYAGRTPGGDRTAVRRMVLVR